MSEVKGRINTSAPIWAFMGCSGIRFSFRDCLYMEHASRHHMDLATKLPLDWKYLDVTERLDIFYL